MLIDNIFIINLETRKDRKNKMINEMKKQNITNFEFFKAIKPNIEEVNKWNKNFCIETPRDDYKIGCLGCLKSHLEVIKISIERRYNNVLILEDDTEFVRNYNELFNDLNEINNSFDMFYLAGSHIGNKIPITNNVMKIIGTYTTGSYIINKKAMEFFINNIEGYNKEVDVFFGKELQPRFNCYASINKITKQREGFSDIQQKNVKYELK